MALPPETVIELLSSGLRSAECPCVGSITKRHAWIHMQDEDRRFWSPTLDLSLDEVPEGTVLRGRFGPHPNVWTMFIFIYAALGLLSLLAAIYGMAQLTLDRPPWALAASAGLAALIGFVYGAAFIGEGLGSQQMTQISIFLDRTIVRTGVPQTQHVQRDHLDNAQG